MNRAKPTILILTTDTGGGHLNLAQSLQGLLETRYDVVIANPQSAQVASFYAAVSRHFLPFLHWQYRFTDYEFASLWLQRVLTAFGRRRLPDMIEQIQPQLIVTTHAMLAYATARANERLRKRVPLVFQLTDLRAGTHDMVHGEASRSLLCSIPRNLCSSKGTRYRERAFACDWQTNTTPVFRRFCTRKK